jgi:N-terminal domain of anti-restriction factor ArdC
LIAALKPISRRGGFHVAITRKEFFEMEKHEFVDPYKLVTETIIDQLEKGIVPWRRPWRRDVGRPQNFHTGGEYHGINVILLNCRRFASPYCAHVAEASSGVSEHRSWSNTAPSRGRSILMVE